MDYKMVGAIGVISLAAGILGFSLLGAKNKQKSTLKRGSLIRILQQIQHQIFMICLKSAHLFTQATGNMRRQKWSQDKIKESLDDQIIEIYEKKQKLILLKHNITKEQFSYLLDVQYGKDEDILKYKENIESMMEKATQGKTPSLSVAPNLKKQLKPSVILAIFKDMKISQLEVILNAFYDEAQRNPNFVVGDNEATTNIIRKVDLFNVKIEYLEKHAPCPLSHFDFIQIIEIYCQESVQFRKKAQKLQELYSTYSDRIGSKVDFNKMRDDFERVLIQADVEVNEASIIQEKTVEEIKQQLSAKDLSSQSQHLSEPSNEIPIEAQVVEVHQSQPQQPITQQQKTEQHVAHNQENHQNTELQTEKTPHIIQQIQETVEIKDTKQSNEETEKDEKPEQATATIAQNKQKSSQEPQQEQPSEQPLEQPSEQLSEQLQQPSEQLSKQPSQQHSQQTSEHLQQQAQVPKQVQSQQEQSQQEQQNQPTRETN